MCTWLHSLAVECLTTPNSNSWSHCCLIWECFSTECVRGGSLCLLDFHFVSSILMDLGGMSVDSARTAVSKMSEYSSHRARNFWVSLPATFFDWGLSFDQELTFDQEFSSVTALGFDRVLLCSEGVRHVIYRTSTPCGNRTHAHTYILPRIQQPSPTQPSLGLWMSGWRLLNPWQYIRMRMRTITAWSGWTIIFRNVRTTVPGWE